MVALWMAVACGTEEPRSVPTSPTVTFAEPVVADQEIVWSDLEELFPARPASLPTAVAELRPGLDGASARAVLDAARAPGVKLYGQTVGTAEVVGTTLVDTTNVGVSLILEERGARLAAVDVSLPDAVAVPMLTTRWGAPTETGYQDGGAPTYRWVVEGAPWVATLYTARADGRPDPDPKAVVKFSPADRPDADQTEPSAEAMPPESH